MSLSPSYVASFRTDTVVGFSLGRPRSIEFQFQFEHKGSIQLLGVINLLIAVIWGERESGCHDSTTLWLLKLSHALFYCCVRV